MKQALLGMTLQEMESVVTSLGMPRFTAKQIAQWVYVKNVDDIAMMTNLSQKNRSLLSENYEIGKMAYVERQESIDSTVKYLFPTSNGLCVETVFIPDDDRATLCVSSQVGCRMGCRFCMTGRQGFQGDCTPRDILNQIYSLPEWERLTNIVYMGQGEPMDNLDAVMRSTQLLMAPYSLAWSPRRITVSTVGVKDKMEQFIKESSCHLALSLHNPFHEGRKSMMPAEGGFSLEDALKVLKKYDWSKQRRLSFEYIVFKGLNDTPRHVKELIRLLSPIKGVRVNLIHFHTIPDTEFQGAADETLVWMRDTLTMSGIISTIRASRGQDIFAACGLLNSKR